tara:strand:- start:5367 stop:5552 length:186 start_codon:yes stop_codon:yes gene_type:complete
MKDKKISPEKLALRKIYMKKYYAKKKLERIETGEYVSICRGKIKRNTTFTMKRGEFIVSFN